MFLLFLKLIMVFDGLRLVIIKPLEGLFYQRLSGALIKSSTGELHMSLTPALTRKIRNLNYQQDRLKILLLVRHNLVKGLQQLDLNKYKFYTVVNNNIYEAIMADKRLKKQQITIKVLKTYTATQVEAKLTLLSSRALWQCLLKKRFSELMAFLFRKEQIHKIEISIGSIINSGLLVAAYISPKIKLVSLVGKLFGLETNN